jgi:hypothetical protein
MCPAAQIKLKFEHFNCNCVLLPVICGKVFHGQFHDRMLKIRMDHSAALIVLFRGDKITEISDWAYGYDVQFEIVSAVFV